MRFKYDYCDIADFIGKACLILVILCLFGILTGIGMFSFTDSNQWLDFTIYSGFVMACSAAVLVIVYTIGAAFYM